MRDASPQVFRVNNRVFSSNTYLYRTEKQDECLIIDPGLDPDSIESELQALGLRPIAVLSTHGHFDHMGSASFFRDKYGIPFYLPQADIKIAKSAAFLLMACRIKAKVTTPPIDKPITDSELFTLGDTKVRYVPVPGHTPGSCFIETKDMLFTGDSLYAEGVGLVDFPGEDPAVLKASLIKIWDLFNEQLMVCPGHGRSLPLGVVKAKNLPLRRFIGLEEPLGETPSAPKTTIKDGTLVWEPT